MACLLLAPVVCLGQNRLADPGTVPNSETTNPPTIPGSVFLTSNQSVLCAGDHATLYVSGGNGVYTWSPARNLSATTGSQVVAGPLVDETYTVTSTNPYTNAPVTATVNLYVRENCCPSSRSAGLIVELPLSQYDATTGSPFAGQPAGTRFHFTGTSPIILSGLAFQPPVGSVLMMDAGKDLYVQGGASLDLAGVSVTAACGDMWGTLLVHPSAAGLTTNKSGALMSQVSHSFGGVVLPESSAWLRLGYTQFLHNRFGVTFGPIPNGAPGSYVTNCQFSSAPTNFKSPWNYQTSTNHRYTAAHITVGGDVSQASIANNVFKSAMYGLSVGTGAEVGLRPATVAPAENAVQALCCPQYITKVNLVGNVFDNIWLAAAQMISPVAGSNAVFTNNNFIFPDAVALPATPQVQTLVSQRSGDATTYGIFNKSAPLRAFDNTFSQGTSYLDYNYQNQRTIQTGIRTTGQFEASGNTIAFLHRGIHLDQGYTTSCTVAGNQFAACQYGVYVTRLTQVGAQLAITCNSFLRNPFSITPGSNYGIYADATSAFAFVLPPMSSLAPVMMNKFDAVGQSGMWAIFTANTSRAGVLRYRTFDDYSFGTAMLGSNVTRPATMLYMASAGQNCAPVYPYFGIPRSQPTVSLAGFTAYPNPAAGFTTIRYEVPAATKRAVLCLRSLSDGQEVSRFELTPQEHEYKLTLAGYPAGLYACALLADGLPVATHRLEIR